MRACRLYDIAFSRAAGQCRGYPVLTGPRIVSEVADLEHRFRIGKIEPGKVGLSQLAQHHCARYVRYLSYSRRVLGRISLVVGFIQRQGQYIPVSGDLKSGIPADVLIPTIQHNIVSTTLASPRPPNTSSTTEELGVNSPAPNYIANGDQDVISTCIPGASR